MKNFLMIDTEGNNFDSAKQELEKKHAGKLLTAIKKHVANSGHNFKNHEIKLFAGMGSVGFTINGELLHNYESLQWRFPSIAKSIVYLVELAEYLNCNDFYDLLYWIDGETI